VPRFLALLALVACAVEGMECVLCGVRSSGAWGRSGGAGFIGGGAVLGVRMMG